MTVPIFDRLHLKPVPWYRGAEGSDVKNTFLLVLIISLLALTEGFAGAQQATKVPRIGFLGSGDPSSPAFESFRQGLRELGYIDGQNIIIEPRFAYGNDWRLNVLAAELVRFNVNVIVTQEDFGVGTMRDMANAVPVVMTYSGDPVAAGIIASLERPGGNVTGIGGLAAGLGGKWLELLKQTVPEVSRVGVLYFRGAELTSPMMKELEIAARSLGVKLQPGGVAGPFIYGPRTGVGAAFTWATRER